MHLLTAGVRHLKQATKIALNHRGRRHVTFRQEVFHLMRRFSPAVAVTSGGIWYYVSTDDSGVSRTVFSQGSYEEDIMSYAIETAERFSTTRPLLAGRTFIDVGANIGTSTLPALLKFGAALAIAVEPDLQNIKLLRCNAISNEVDERLRVLPVALSNRTGKGTLERAEASWGDHRVRLHPGLPDGSFKESMRSTLDVELVTFEDAMGELSVDLNSVGMVWMDTQGHEGHILAGAGSLLESQVPVVIEYWPYGLGRVGGLTLLHGLITGHYRRVIDLRASMATGSLVDLPAAEMPELSGRYPGETYTDLLLLS